MSRSPELKPTKYDALVALTVLLLAAALGARYWPPRADAGALTVTVTADGAEIDRFALRDLERVYTAGGYTLRVTATAEGVRVAESDCPGHDCVRTGTVSRAGQSIVCLPARIVVTLRGAGGGTYDAVAGAGGGG